MPDDETMTGGGQRLSRSSFDRVTSASLLSLDFFSPTAQNSGGGADGGSDGGGGGGTRFGNYSSSMSKRGVSDISTAVHCLPSGDCGAAIIT